MSATSKSVIFFRNFYSFSRGVRFLKPVCEYEQCSNLNLCRQVSVFGSVHLGRCTEPKTGIFFNLCLLILLMGTNINKLLRKIILKKGIRTYRKAHSCILYFLIDLPFVRYQIFSDISERNNDYSDTLDFRRGGGGGGHVFCFGGPWLRIRYVNIFYI